MKKEEAKNLGEGVIYDPEEKRTCERGYMTKGEKEEEKTCERSWIRIILKPTKPNQIYHA